VIIQWRHPWSALGELDQGVEEREAVLGGGGQVAADGAELPGAGHGAQAAGDFLPELDHADVALAAVVIRWRAEIAGEPQVVVLAVDQAASQAWCLRISWPALAAVWLAPITAAER